VETAAETTKTMSQLVLVNIALVNWPEQFMLSVNQKWR